MKKVLGIVLCLILLVTLASCGAEEEIFDISMNQLLEANRTEILLENYSSIQIHLTEGTSEVVRYVDETLAFEEFPDFYSVTCGEDLYYNEEGIYCRELYAGVDGVGYWYEWLGFDGDSTQAEEITDVKQTDNGIVIQTTLSRENIDLLMEEGERIESVKMEYLVDAEDLRLLSVVQGISYTDGTVREITETIEYDAEMPEKAAELYSRLTQTENVRTVTLVLDPGTAEEASYSVTVPKGDRVFPVYPEDYSDVLYMDAACTQEFSSADDYDTDLTLYAPKK